MREGDWHGSNRLGKILTEIKSDLLRREIVASSPTQQGEEDQSVDSDSESISSRDLEAYIN